LAQGQVDFVQNCGICHTVRGTLAHGRVGPDLSHLMTRKTIAAGTLPNTIGALSGWISEPQRIKPGNQMPDLNLPVAQLDHIRNFLATLN
jgi:cytochrome c oxidase subunit 2